MRHKVLIIILSVIILLFCGVALGFRSAGMPFGEWVRVNLFTLSTKGKQAEYLRLATEHLGEPNIYAQYLRQAEYMAEVILYLDGREVAVAENFEAVTREQEIALSKERPISHEALATARIENEKMFDYLVKNYQFNTADIKKYQKIVSEHMAIVQELLAAHSNAKAEAFLVEAKKYQAAGLNIQAYEHAKKAKDVVYGRISN